MTGRAGDLPYSLPKPYAHAASAQWDPAAAVPWEAEFTLPGEIEDAVVQVMTYLVENEQAALVIPARLLARVHPHFREVVQLLAVQAADEVRHMEVFTRRALLKGGAMGTSSAGSRASLATLLAEPGFSLNFNGAVAEHPEWVTEVAYLHNATEFGVNGLREIETDDQNQLFTAQRRGESLDHLRTRLSDRHPGARAADELLAGKTVPSKQLMSVAAQEVRHREQFVLPGQQQVAYRMVLNAVRKAK